MARMKIVLKQSVDSLGEVGDVVRVSGGYARNFLIPRGLAVPATSGNVKQADTWKNSRSAKQAKARSGAESLKARLESAPVRITAQAGPDGRLFGSVTPADIAAALKAQHEAEIDRHVIELAEPIRHLGLHDVTIPLMGDVDARVTIEVVEANAGA